MWFNILVPPSSYFDAEKMENNEVSILPLKSKGGEIWEDKISKLTTDLRHTAREEVGGESNREKEHKETGKYSKALQVLWWQENYVVWGEKTIAT